MEKIQELLDEAKEQLDKRKKNLEEIGADFNIFSVLDRERKEESTHCRLIYELLNPEGSHGCGDEFLKLFFDTINKPFPKSEKIIVERERHTDYGRPDLLIWGNSFCYPIEVKIDAGDQYRQVERYLKFAKKQGKGQRDFDATVYYLTLDGHEPSEESRGDVQSEQIEYISFSCQIKAWIVQCAEKKKDIPNIQIILKQYIRLIDRLKGEIPMEKLVKKIFDSKDFYDSAVEIAKALPSVRAKKMESVFSRIEAVVGDQLQKIENDPQYPSYLEGCKKYYNTKRIEDPSLIYLLNKDEGKLKVELWFQVNRYTDLLSYGVVLHIRKGNDLVIPETKNDILEFSSVFEDSQWKEAIKEIAKGKYTWWVWEKLLPQTNPINFRPNSAHYSDLFDEKMFEDTMKKIEEEIKQQLDHIKKTGLCRD